MGNHGNSSSFMHHLIILLTAASTAALVVIVYHCIAVCWYNRISRRRHRRASAPGQEETTCNFENSVAELIPVHKYRKDEGLVGEDDTCAVCLCEFEEGEELRTLPECVHTFHASCIDMWLYSHSTCPVCRTDNTPSPIVFRLFSDSNLDESTTAQPNHEMAPNLGRQVEVL